MLLRSLLILVAIVTAACERERHAPNVVAPETPQVAGWAPPAEIEPLVTGDPFGPTITFASTRRHPECWESLERDAKPVDPFPFTDPVERAEHFASCGVEALAQLHDGATVVAWGAAQKPGVQAHDLRIAVWEASGRLRWTVDLDRSRQAANWAANYRSSFITALPPKHVCAGTLYEGDTQVICMATATGEATWKGSLPFWAGIAPQTGVDGLVVADLSAITKRYPFNGAEMQHRKLEGLGGRAGYYATDGHHLYFAPSRLDAPPLVSYDLATFKEVWRTNLPGAPTAALAHAFDALDRVLLKIGENLFALDTTSGNIVWAYEIGDDVPSIAADDNAIYVVSRLAEVPNRLTAIEPKSGKRLWSTDTPSGTLRVTVVEGKLFIGSIRAVQHVTLPPENVDGR